MLFDHRRHIARSAALLLPFVLAAGGPQTSDPEPEATLVKPLQLIATAFRTGKPEPLTPLLPQEGKIFLALDSFGGGVGYFSRDQVYFILGGIFNRNETINFSVRPQRPSAADKRRSDSGLSYCVGIWTFHRHDGAKSENQIFFVLSMKKGVWSLVEIREAQ